MRAKKGEEDEVIMKVCTAPQAMDMHVESAADVGVSTTVNADEAFDLADHFESLSGEREWADIQERIYEEYEYNPWEDSTPIEYRQRHRS